MLAEEHEHLHRLPRLPHTICFGQTRKVNWQSTISVGGAIYSVPHELVDERVWVRVDGSELIVVHVDGPAGPREVARHELTTPGRPALCDEHYPPKPAGALDRKPQSAQLGGARVPRARRGRRAVADRRRCRRCARVRRKMAEAIDLAKLHGPEQVEQALATCAQAGRFADGDLQAILAHQQQQAVVVPLPLRASEESSLQRSTRSWEGFGR